MIIGAEGVWRGTCSHVHVFTCACVHIQCVHIQCVHVQCAHVFICPCLPVTGRFAGRLDQGLDAFGGHQGRVGGLGGGGHHGQRLWGGCVWRMCPAHLALSTRNHAVLVLPAEHTELLGLVCWECTSVSTQYYGRGLVLDNMYTLTMTTGMVLFDSFTRSGVPRIAELCRPATLT